jgi:hypothetical protein
MKRPTKRPAPKFAPLTPDYTRPVPTVRDSINEELATSNLLLRRELAGRDKSITRLEATIKELRTQVKFLSNAARLLPKEKA